MHTGPARYGRRPPERNVAVERCVQALPAERLREIQATDAAVFGTPPGQVGPMETLLNTFPTKNDRGAIVTGAFGKWSQNLIDLLAQFADMGAAGWQRKLAEPTVTAARSKLLKRMRGELCVCVARGHAKLIIERVRSLPAQLARRMHGGVWANALRSLCHLPTARTRSTSSGRHELSVASCSTCAAVATTSPAGRSTEPCCAPPSW